MIRTLLLLFLAISMPQTCFAAVTFDWAYVGNAGNAPDPETGFGAVGYNYAIGKHEVTNSQYTAFLNAIDPTGTNTLALYNLEMAANFGGIEKNGAVDGARYVAKAGRELNPVTWVSFLNAMRFTNWLHNGQGAGDTEAGAYTIGDGLNEVRSANARYWIPSEDEWYKAAYHYASAGTAGVYFDYATGSDSIPMSDQPSDGPAAVNYFNDDGVANGFNDGYAVSGSMSYPSSTNPFTNVGAYTAAESPYGTFDQTGNVWEWNEAVFSPFFRGLRGGSWINISSDSRADVRGNGNPWGFNYDVGFRVATIPEPTSLALAAMLAGCGVMGRRPYE